MSRPRVLILGGTAEARELAVALAGLPLDVTTSLSGATRRPAAVPGDLRVGGFGGVEGLSAWIAQHGVRLLIDATHPFALRISGNAGEAALAAACPLLRLERSPWSPADGERWHRHKSLMAAVGTLPDDVRVFLAIGSGQVPQIVWPDACSFLLRSIEPVSGLPSNVTNVVARPPFTVGEETKLMRRHAITHLVARNSGGASGRAKLAAAASLGVEIHMVERPPAPPGGDRVATVAAALGWVRRWLALDTASDTAP